MREPKGRGEACDQGPLLSRTLQCIERHWSDTPRVVLPSGLGGHSQAARPLGHPRRAKEPGSIAAEGLDPRRRRSLVTLTRKQARSVARKPTQCATQRRPERGTPRTQTTRQYVPLRNKRGERLSWARRGVNTSTVRRVEVTRCRIEEDYQSVYSSKKGAQQRWQTALDERSAWDTQGFQSLATNPGRTRRETHQQLRAMRRLDTPRGKQVHKKKRQSGERTSSGT